jgi:Mg-chelatase subunit ChlD
VFERPRTANLGTVLASPTFNQLGILVLDGSGSMEEPTAGNITKAQAVNVAVREVFTRFRRSRYKRNFSFAVVTFDQNAQPHTPITAATDIDDSGNYDPMENHGGGTNIGAGLLEAKRIAGDFLRKAPQDPAAMVVIIVMSDGRDGEGGATDPAETRRIAEEIKRNPAITICSTYFAGMGSQDPQAQDHLRALASDSGNNYKTVYDAESLRAFFRDSLSINTNVTIR